MKKAFVLILACALIAGLFAGCNAKEESAGETVASAIEAVKANDKEGIAKYWGGSFDDAGDDMYGDMKSALFGGIEYEITAENETEDSAFVDVDITNADMGVIMADVISEVFPVLMQDALKTEDERMTDDEIDSLIADTFVQMLNRDDNQTVTNSVTITLTRADGAWKIDDGNGAAVDAMLGGLGSVEEGLNSALAA